MLQQTWFLFFYKKTVIFILKYALPRDFDSKLMSFFFLQTISAESPQSQQTVAAWVFSSQTSVFFRVWSKLVDFLGPLQSDRWGYALRWLVTCFVLLTLHPQLPSKRLQGWWQIYNYNRFIYIFAIFQITSANSTQSPKKDGQWSIFKFDKCLFNFAQNFSLQPYEVK